MRARSHEDHPGEARRTCGNFAARTVPRTAEVRPRQVWVDSAGSPLWCGGLGTRM